MTTQQLLLVGVDGTAGGRRALEWALRQAVTTDAAVEVVTAWQWGAAPHEANMDDIREVDQRYTDDLQQREIAAVLERVPAPLTMSRQVIEGDAATVLIAAARHADLLVLGSHGHSHIGTAVLGSVSATCVRKGSTPVVVVPARDAEPTPEELVALPSADGR